MRFIVYGAGAIGSTIGGYLIGTGYDVTLVANPKHVEKIREVGLRVVFRGFLQEHLSSLGQRRARRYVSDICVCVNKS